MRRAPFLLPTTPNRNTLVSVKVSERAPPISYRLGHQDAGMKKLPLGNGSAEKVAVKYHRTEGARYRVVIGDTGELLPLPRDPVSDQRGGAADRSFARFEVFSDDHQPYPVDFRKCRPVPPWFLLRYSRTRNPRSRPATTPAEI